MAPGSRFEAEAEPGARGMERPRSHTGTHQGSGRHSPLHTNSREPTLADENSTQINVLASRVGPSAVNPSWGRPATAESVWRGGCWATASGSRRLWPSRSTPCPQTPQSTHSPAPGALMAAGGEVQLWGRVSAVLQHVVWQVREQLLQLQNTRGSESAGCCVAAEEAGKRTAAASIGGVSIDQEIEPKTGRREASPAFIWCFQRPE